MSKAVLRAVNACWAVGLGSIVSELKFAEPMFGDVHGLYEDGTVTIPRVSTASFHDGLKWGGEDGRMQSTLHEIGHFVFTRGNVANNKEFRECFSPRLAETDPDFYISPWAEESPEEDFCEMFAHYVGGVQVNTPSENVLRKAKFIARLVEALSGVEGKSLEADPTLRDELRHDQRGARFRRRAELRRHLQAI